MKKPLIDPFAIIFNRYLEEKKFIKKFLKYWGTMSVTDTKGVTHEVLLPANYIWSDDGAEIHYYPYVRGGNRWPDGSVYKGDEAVLEKQRLADEDAYNSVNCGYEENPTFFYENGVAYNYVYDDQGLVVTDADGNPVKGEPKNVSDCVTIDGMVGWPRAGTRVRKLLEFMNQWKDIRNHPDIPDTNETWLFLNPAKGVGLNDDNVVKGLNAFINKYKDKQGRVKLKVKIILTDRLPIPGFELLPQTDSEYSQYDNNYLRLPNHLFNAAIKQEDVYLLDANGEIVFRDVYQKDANGVIVLDKYGKPIPTGAKYPVIQQESVTSYDALYDYIKSNSNHIWNTFPVLPKLHNTPDLDIDTSSLLTIVPEMFIKANRGMYEKVVAKTAAVYAEKYKKKTNSQIFGSWSVNAKTNNNSGVRIESASRGIYTWSETVDRSSSVSGSYRDYTQHLGNDVYMAYSGVNSQTNGSKYEIKYTVPALDLVLVLRNPATLELVTKDDGTINTAETTPVVDTILTAAKTDYWQEVTTSDDYGSNTSTQLILSSVNGYDINKILLSFYGDSDNPSVGLNDLAITGEYKAWLGNIVVPVQINNPNFWVMEQYRGYDRVYWYYLKKEVLTTNKYIKKRSDRIKFVLSLIDTDYDVPDGGGGFGAFILTAFIVVVAAVIAGPAGAAVAGSAATAATVIALQIIIFSLIISIATMVVANSHPALGRQLASFNKAISPIVMIASIYLTITGMYDMYNGLTNTSSTVGQEITEQALMDTFKQTGYTGSTWASNTLSDKVLDVAKSMVDDIVNMAKNQLSSFNLEKSIQVVDMVAQLHYESELAKLKRSVENKQRQLDEQASVKEERKLSDHAMLSLLSNLDPLVRCVTLDAHEVAYEPVVSTMHTGNVQKTAHLALMGDGAVTYINNIA